MIVVSAVDTRSYDKMAKVELRCGDGEKETLNQQSIPFPVPMEVYYVAWMWLICVPTHGCFTC